MKESWKAVCHGSANLTRLQVASVELNISDLGVDYEARDAAAEVVGEREKDARAHEVGGEGGHATSASELNATSVISASV